MRQIHSIPPVFDDQSKILILGSFPSVKSRQAEFFYGHAQNRFWQVIAALIEYPPPQTIAQKKAMLLESGIAVWDVIQSCEITGSSDSSIKNVAPNDLSIILRAAPIQAIFVNGQTAGRLYQKFLKEKTGRECTVLPSTSPANAACSPAQLITQWRVILPFLR